MQNNATLGARICKARKDAHLSQDELANSLNISKRALLNYEKDETEPSVSVALKISDICKCDKNWLLTGLQTQYDQQAITVSPIAREAFIAKRDKITELLVQEIEKCLFDTDQVLPLEAGQMSAYIKNLKSEDAYDYALNFCAIDEIASKYDYEVTDSAEIDKINNYFKENFKIIEKAFNIEATVRKLISMLTVKK